MREKAVPGRALPQPGARIRGAVAELAAERPAEMSGEALALRRATHSAIAAVDDAIDHLRFNVAVAKIHELANAAMTRLAAKPGDDASRFALHEAGEVLVHLIAPMMPHLAEECWSALGRPGLVAEARWPEAEASLLVSDTITLPVQINGKRRDEITVPAAATPAEVEQAVRELESVVRASDGRPLKKVIVVPQRIVNVVV